MDRDVFGGCTSLSSVFIPKSLGEDGSYTYQPFDGCSALSTVTFENGIAKIPQYLFYKTGLTQITIPATVTAIDNYAFSECGSLEKVIFAGNNVTSIGDGVFFKCSSLSDITLPAHLESLGSYTFQYCPALTSINIPKSLTVAGDYGPFNNAVGLKTVVFEDDIETITANLFRENNSLESIVIPDTVTVIGKYAFFRCSALESVTLCEGLETIGYGAFWNCSALESIIIPDSVTELGYSALRECNSLTTVELGAGVTSIGNDMIASCPDLETVIFKADDVTVGQYAFNYSTDHLTFYGKHGAQNLRTALKNYYDRPYIGTDEHTGMTWTWNGYTSAALGLSCDDCDLGTRTIDAAISSRITTPPTCTEDGVGWRTTPSRPGSAKLRTSPSTRRRSSRSDVRHNRTGSSSHRSKSRSFLMFFNRSIRSGFAGDAEGD